MTEKRAAVLSADNSLTSLVENELLLLDFSVERLKNIPKNLDGYDVVVLDTDLSDVFPACDAKIKLSLRSTAGGATNILSFPFLLADLRRIVVAPASQGTPKEPEKEQNVIFADKKSLTVSLMGRTVKLSQSEFIILEALCKKPGKYIPLAELNSLLGATEGNIAAVYVCHLRRKLETPFGIKLIFTSGGKGYMTKFIMK